MVLCIALAPCRAEQIYGEPVPELVTDRMEQELKALEEYGGYAHYLVAGELIRKSRELGYPVSQVLNLV